MQKVDVVVVGGGIAGLTAAIYAAIAGKQTVVIEKQNRLGGRAISNKKKGAYFNLDAHSLYKGDAYATFRELGLTLQGKRPSSFAYGVWKGKLNTLPSDMKSLFTTPLLSWKGKMEFASCLMKVKKADTRQFDRISIRKVLFIKKKIDNIGIYYTLPGGGQESGETMEDTILRECAGRGNDAPCRPF